jgi:CelD/BcsL family acetyltransferase involved in cellulose biosynthesis
MSLYAEAELQIEVLEGFDDPSLRADWDRVLEHGHADSVFLCWEWQREWWQAFGGDRLLLVVARRSASTVAIAPLFALENMLFFVGSGGSDYLDFLGELDEQVLAAMLDRARAQLPGFAGITLYHVPADSPTAALLPGISRRLGLELYREETTGAPYLDLTDRDLVDTIIGSTRMRKEEARMRRIAPLQVRVAGADELDPWLDLFFAQHTARWREAGEESLATDDARSFYRSIVAAGHRSGWLQFTMLEWDERPAAFDISLVRGGRHLTYLVSRDSSIRDYSPGRLLQRHVILGALNAGARRFDYGLGEESHKLRHASGTTEVVNWSLYPE